MTRSRAFALAIFALAAGALAFRLPELGIRPFHGDEAVHAFKFLDLWRRGVYRYDVNEFHGPTLYYAALPWIWIQGRRSFTECIESDFRLPIALFGAAMVLLVAPLASGLGRRAAVVAGALLAISPAFVFYSRYYIQETLLTFFTLAVIVCGWRYSQSRQSRWLTLAGVSAGCMIATKETSVLAFAAMAGALLLTRLWASRFGGRAPVPAPKWEVGALALSALVAILVGCLFISGFGSNHEGPLGAFTGPADYLRSFTPWLQRAGGASLHVYSWSYYLSILLWTRHGHGPVYSEALIVVLAVVGAAIALFSTAEARAARAGAGATDAPSGDADGASEAATIPERAGEAAAIPDPSPARGDRRAVFSGSSDLLRFLTFYTLLLTLEYSAIPYKTPWCMLSFLTIMALLAGVGAVALLDLARNRQARVAVALVLVAAWVQLAAQSYRASYQAVTDPDNPYVYAQPVQDVETMGQWVWDVAHYSGRGPGMLVKVIWVDDYHWPIAWYLREFRNIQRLEGFYHDTSDPSAPLVLASPEFEDELTKKLEKTHIMAKFFGIRPGVFAQAWVRLDVWERYLKMRPRPVDE
jgi:uncharacterized protein (TIGR03663 family)